MVSITLAIDELKSSLAEVIRGALEKGFELVAGYAGGKIAKSVEGTLKDVAKAGAAAATGCAGAIDLMGLREQIKDNAMILFPLMHHDTKAIHIITTGMPDTGGIRAVLIDATAVPPCVIASKKHPSLLAAMQDLLDTTQTHLKFRNAVLYGTTPSPNLAAESFDAFNVRDTRPAPAVREPYASFDTIPDESFDSTAGGGLGVDMGWLRHEEHGATAAGPKRTPHLDRKDSVTDEQLRWDPNCTTNPHFGGFDYASFQKRGDDEEATKKRYDHGRRSDHDSDRTAVDPWY